ncbi:MAG: ABC transporter permease [Thermoleophilia bacterium]
MSTSRVERTWPERLRNNVSDVLTLVKRNLRRYERIPQLLVFSTIQPVMFLLLFNYVFGGAIGATTGTGNYIQFLLPGILMQVALFGSTATSVGLADDLSKGMVDRFRSLPIARSAVLAGRTGADLLRNTFVVLLMVAVGMVLGFRFQGGFAYGAGAMLLVLFFGYAFSWISATIGLTVHDPETVQVASFIWIFPLVFASGAFVPVATMPGWLQPFAEHQPVTVTVNAVRSMMLEGAPGDLGQALIWIAGILIVFISLAVWAYKRSA